MNTVVLKQLLLINKIWASTKPKTAEGKAEKEMMLQTFKESILDIKRELKLHEYFETEDWAEIES